MKEKLISWITGCAGESRQSRDRRIRIVAGIGLVGIALIFLSSLSDGSRKGNAENLFPIYPYPSAENYAEKTEKRLKELLSCIRECGKVQVMVTLDSDTEVVYAAEGKSVLEEDGSRYRNENEEDFVFAGESGRQIPVVRTVREPRIKGVVVICEGGDTARVKAKITEAAATALGLPLNRVCVIGL